jgi:hypothetical protein
MFAGITTETIRHNRWTTHNQHHRMPQAVGQRVRRAFDYRDWERRRRVLVESICREDEQGQCQSQGLVQAGPPSTVVHEGFGHDPAPLGGSLAATEPELGEPEAATGYGPRRLTEQGALTLISATKHPEISDATVQADLARR